MSNTKNYLTDAYENAGPSRRRFLQQAGSMAGLAMLVSACSKSSSNTAVTPATNYNAPSVNADGSINLGGSDIGLLNYAYALEQIESAFYQQVVQSQYSGISSDEAAILTDIRNSTLR